MFKKESALLSAIMIIASKMGHRLFRNNIGLYQDRVGNWVRYGVANPGGSDLIGWTSLVITQEMVGKKVAVFTAVEGKTGKLKATKEQLAFLQAVRDAGGFGILARDSEDYSGVLI